jgi:hypothetical protein
VTETLEAIGRDPDDVVSLSDLRRRPVILAFYPADWSSLHDEMDVDVDRFRRELDEGAHGARVEEDCDSGVLLVAILNFSQTRMERFTDRDCSALELPWREWCLGARTGRPDEG